MLCSMTQQGKKTPHPQLDNRALQALIRPYVPELIQKALDLVKKADNDSVSLGAIKLLLAKVIPDLKSQDFTGEDGKSLIEKIIIVKAGDEDKVV